MDSTADTTILRGIADIYRGATPDKGVTVMKIAQLAIAALLPVGLWSPAIASDFTSFEAAMRIAYGDYRTALFMTNMGKASESAKAISKFSAEWTALKDRPAPPQYADDAHYGETMSAIVTIASTAGEKITAGALPEAHEALEGIRDEIGDMHIRTGLFGISDRMNAYHARMEEVIGKPDMSPEEAHQEAAVLDYLLSDIATHPPAEADDSFAALVASVQDSIAKLESAGDAAAVRSAIDGLKAPYSKLFLKFG
jgi:hypothetical protein